MPCDSRPFRAEETLQQRVDSVREKTEALSKALALGKVKVKVGAQGAIAFIGWDDRAGITDACAYRRIMAKGSALAKLAIETAEKAAGRTVDRQVVAGGLHSHDGGNSWERH